MPSKTVGLTLNLGTLLVLSLIFGSLPLIQPDVLRAAPESSEKVQASVATPVNVNKANLEELESIQGIGPALAERIVAHREEFGPFQSVDDLANVHGIGGIKLQKLKSQVSI